VFALRYGRISPCCRYGQRASVETLFSSVECELEARASGPSLPMQKRDAPLLGIGFNLDLLRHHYPFRGYSYREIILDVISNRVRDWLRAASNAATFSFSPISCRTIASILQDDLSLSIQTLSNLFSSLHQRLFISKIRKEGKDRRTSRGDIYRPDYAVLTVLALNVDSESLRL
jgi:hypothetical protein